ncbi:MAG: DUF4625 domain-containing protein [Rikenellaceae bacterium]|nr:DUF4625 domain-containing protein [Rikenellaceae bacterium]
MFSCYKDSDTTPPVIDLKNPVEGAVLEIGDEHGIYFEMELSDNEMLSSYKIEIHNNFDAHGHSHSKAASETAPFFFQKSWDISGQRNASIHHYEIVIPEDATPGKYHLLVYCTDAAGNETNIARNIILEKNRNNPG